MPQINTAQNVNINYSLASVGSRIGARLLDWLFVGLFAIIMILIFAAIGSNNTIFHGDTGNVLIVILVLTMLLIISMYQLLFPYFWEGQTPGKRIVGIRIVREDGIEASFGTYFVRWLLGFVDGMFYNIVGLVVMLASEKRQRVADLVAKTVVISTQVQHFNQRPDFERIVQDYQPVFTQVLQLSDNDVRIIREAYSRARTINDVETIKKLRQKIEQTISQINPSMNDRAYIETVLRDYQYFTEQ
ncbi:MAG: RDD family protein [Paludibacter sp.]|nr:RDD family protein [Paludibacter sp.]